MLTAMRMPLQRTRFLAVVTGALLLATPAASIPLESRDGSSSSDPFAILDKQNWVNPDNMTWADYKYPPGTNWSNPAVKGTSRNFNIALVAVDYSDRPFVVTQAAGSTIYGNPQPIVAGIARDAVPTYYRDLLNTPNELNNGHTLHEYWMGDSFGEYGVDLTAFGPYELPSLSYQYGIDDEEGGFNEGGCPADVKCSVDLRTDALGAWRAQVGNATADSFELVFILSAGQDESSTWQEFGEMKFLTKEDVPDSFGPPGNGTNYAHTRYVEWSSWAAASNIWPNAGGGSSTQGESSGMAVYAHELSHLIGIGDNYNNPYGNPLRRAYTGPFSMLDRGSFNGPGGPHTRWQIPALKGASLGSLHTMRDKKQLGLISNDSILIVPRTELASNGIVVANIIARSVNPENGLMGIRVPLEADLSPKCNISTDVFCDGGGYNNYDMEVVDRMGADSFTTDSGVLISKTKNSDDDAPFQWVIDSNPQDIKIIDFYRPNGTAAYITLGDYRQLADAPFHAGTRSGSEFEYVDQANGLHLYIIEPQRSTTGVLSYTVAARSLSGKGASKYEFSLSSGKVKSSDKNRATGRGVTCEFKLSNKGTFKAGANATIASSFFKSDVYRLSAKVDGRGWKVELPNELATAKIGSSTVAKVAVAADKKASDDAVVTLTVVSESDPSKSATAKCHVEKD